MARTVKIINLLTNRIWLQPLFRLIIYYRMANVCASFYFPDDDDRDMQGDRAVDYGKRHQAIDIL